jgi:GNAT superfamily N-acetyltransferase
MAPDSPVAALEPSTLAEHQADGHWLALAGDRLLARCSLWWRAVPHLPGERLGLIGHYGATPGSAGVHLLEQACAELAARGCSLAVGPMDGSTWRSYRLVTWRGSAPPFFLEPDHPADWVSQWQGAGFTTLAGYRSTAVALPAEPDPRLGRIQQRLQGVRVRTLDLGDLDHELGRIHDLSLTAFADNVLYTPIGLEPFRRMYRGLRPHLDPELVLLAEDEAGLAGFLFALPDHLAAARGDPLASVILKSAAVRPGRARAGLGIWLGEEVHRRAQARGYRQAIHALMHDANPSRNIGTRGARLLRRYTLFARHLDASRRGTATR